MRILYPLRSQRCRHRLSGAQVIDDWPRGAAPMRPPVYSLGDFMKSADIKIGEVYLAKVSGQLQRVRVTSDFTRYNPTRHGWRAVNLATGRELRIKSSQRLRPLVDTE